MNKLTALVLALFLLYRCDRNISHCCCVNYDPYVAVFVRDANGKNLLNPNTPGAYYQFNIGVQCLDNKGKYVEVLDENAYKIIQKDTVFYLSLRTCSTMYLKWSDCDTDTLRCTSLSECGYVVSAVNYNGEDVPFVSIYLNNGRVIEITKK